MKIELPGLVIREFDFGENNKYITILTAEKGVITAFVKSVKNLKNKTLAGCELFAYSNFILYVGKSGFTINEAIPNELFFSLRYDLTVFSLAGYFCEVTNAMLPEKKYAKDFLRIFLNCLYFLEKGEKNIFLLKSVFELRACCAAGFMPNLVCCKNCGIYESEPIYFLISEGSLNCNKCVNHENLNNTLLNKVLLHTLRHIVYSPVEKLFSFNLPEKLFLELSKITQNYILSHADHNFKSLEIFKRGQTYVK